MVGPPGIGFGSGMSAGASASSSAKKKASEPDSAAAASASAARNQARSRRRRRATLHDHEFSAMDVDVDPDWGPRDQEPVASTTASDRGAGTFGFAGTVRQESVAKAAGLATLPGDEFGTGPTMPMLPGIWASDSEAPGAPQNDEDDI
jgi:PPE-repeat protein